MGWVRTQEAEIRVQEVGSFVKRRVSALSVQAPISRTPTRTHTLKHHHTRHVHYWGHSLPAEADPSHKVAEARAT